MTWSKVGENLIRPLKSRNLTLSGKLAVDGQNLIYCDGFEENVQKLPKKADSCANMRTSDL